MNRNVTIVVIILVLVVIAGYLIWLRSKYQPTVSPQVKTEEVMSPTPSASASAQPATSSAKEATGSMKAKTATGSSIKK